MNEQDPIEHINNIIYRKSFRGASMRWYQKIEELGRGGNAVTLLVMSTQGDLSGMLYAMKIFYKLSQRRRREQFIHEIEFLQKCDHPAIMKVVDTGTYRARVDDNNHIYFPYVIADYLPRTLHDVIRERTASFVEKTSYIVQLLSALNYLSSLQDPVIHRDIKPQNIFVKGKTCVLGDFGLMKRISSNKEVDKEIFEASMLPGMPFYYRTPDLVSFVRGESELTVASDVFQLGLVAAHLFTGRNPCIRPRNILDPVELEPIGEVPGAQGGGVAKLIARMLDPDPSTRPKPIEMLDPWQNVLWEAAKKSIELEGRAF